MLRTTCFALAACFAGSAIAQNSARPDPADPKVTVSTRPYESFFKDYRPYVDPEVARWRQSNEEMGRLGGHVGHVPKASGTATKPPAIAPGHDSRGGRK